ncbi:MAG: PAS domain S-box protein [Candidatus Acidiferrales bacterium]
MQDDSKFSSLLAVAVVVAVPAIGVWELLRQDEAPSLRTFRLLMVLACGLCLAVLALLAEQTAKAGWKNNVRDLEALHSDFVAMLKSIVRQAKPSGFRATDDNKYASLLAVGVVVAVPAIGVWELLRQDETPSLRTFRLLVVLACGLLLAVLALLTEQLTKARFKNDAKKLEALNRELVEVVRAILRRADPRSLRTTFVNKHVEEILGYPVASWLEDPTFWVEHIHPEDRDRTLAFTAKSVEEQRHHDLEYRMIAADGRTVWLHEIVNVVVEDGAAKELVAVSGDITARKLAEEARALFRKLIDGSNDAIEVLDPATLRFLDINERACLDLGYDREEMLTMTAFDIDPVLDVSLFSRVDRKLRESGGMIMESQHRRKDGTTFPVEINIKYIQLERDYVVAVVRDIAERKILEGTLSSLSRRLIDAQEEERRNVARELREDLNQRVALLQIGLGQLERDVPSLSLRAREQLHSLAEVATTVASSIHNLSHQLHPSLLDLLGPVASVESLCKEVSDRHNLAVQFVHHCTPERFPKDVTLCLYRITQEALQNVVKHSGAAAAKVELLCQNDRIDLCISDSGVGFSPEAVRGTAGLGLISMRERLRLVGGQLSVESELSQGTRIRARIVQHADDRLIDNRR